MSDSHSCQRSHRIPAPSQSHNESWPLGSIRLIGTSLGHVSQHHAARHLSLTRPCNLPACCRAFWNLLTSNSRKVSVQDAALESSLRSISRLMPEQTLHRGCPEGAAGAFSHTATWALCFQPLEQVSTFVINISQFLPVQPRISFACSGHFGATYSRRRRGRQELGP